MQYFVVFWYIFRLSASLGFYGYEIVNFLAWRNTARGRAANRTAWVLGASGLQRLQLQHLVLNQHRVSRAERGLWSQPDVGHSSVTNQPSTGTDTPRLNQTNPRHSPP